jgi:methylated-DNA-[protein]-cysteine S-methyltransferase
MRQAATPAPMPAVVRLPTCVLGLRISLKGEIQEIHFLPPETQLDSPSAPLIQRFIAEIAAYRDNPAHAFSLPLAQRGTAFQQRVWQSIRAIPPGQTRHYGELAYYLDSAARAVGQACGANPFPLVTPCHRVLAKSGLGGFAHAQNGWLLETKLWLLQHEQAI